MPHLNEWNFVRYTDGGDDAMFDIDDSLSYLEENSMGADSCMDDDFAELFVGASLETLVDSTKASFSANRLLPGIELRVNPWTCLWSFKDMTEALCVFQLPRCSIFNPSSPDVFLCVSHSAMQGSCGLALRAC